ncbi:flagellar export chaperone FliS [Janthinobacterium sp. 75]|jgi:flagellar protein FliS|uniref:flagellar export chaperone FliS n=1 Tax=unclassified Janthinobacterium TaxID=2610881 RepID=UPI0010628B12|nr:flagellar export chaperone FliS [Janthinobacterium sp. 75]TDY34295.1 flagellar protein FliS [Janthinobacterium sp. 75]
MFGTQQRGVNAYAKVGLETGIVSASPHKLIVMLYDGALVAVLSAQMHMKSGNIPEKGKSISKAIQIIDNGLRASLDKEAGGQIAEGLDALYEYMGARLLTANIHNDLGMLEEVQRLLTDLRETWNAIGTTPAAIAGADLKRMPSLASA